MSPDDFLSADLRTVFEHASELARAGISTHPMIVADALWKSGAAPQLSVLAGFEAYPEEAADTPFRVLLRWLTDEVQEAYPVAVGAEYWAREVRRLSGLRKTASALHELESQALKSAASDGGEPRALIADALARLTALAPSPMDGPQSLMDVVEEDAADMDAILDNPRDLTGFSSGLPSIDTPLNGWEPGRVIVVAAGTAVGKTLFSLRVARGIAGANQVPVLYLSLEMSRHELERRMIWAMSGVSRWQLRTQGHTTPGQREAIEQARCRLSILPLLLDDSSGPEWGDLRAAIEQACVQHGVRVVVLDHIDLVQVRKGDKNRHLQLSGVMSDCKALAKRLNVCFIVLSQVNRETRMQERGPALSNLRESGGKEETADVVILLRRPAAEKEMHGNDPRQNELICHIAKNRDGETGKRTLYVDLHRQIVEEMELR